MPFLFLTNRSDKIVESIADLDPLELEREFGSGAGAVSLARLHPSHRPRRNTAVAGAF